MMYPYSYHYEFYYGNQITFLAVAILVAVILSVVLYFTFLNKKNEGKYEGIAKKIYNFFNFNKFYVEDILKLVYIISAAVLTVVGVTILFSQSFIAGLLILIAGNVALRIGYELIMMFIIMCRKTVSFDRKFDKVAAFFDGYIEFMESRKESEDDEEYETDESCGNEEAGSENGVGHQGGEKEDEESCGLNRGEDRGSEEPSGGDESSGKKQVSGGESKEKDKNDKNDE